MRRCIIRCLLQGYHTVNRGAPASCIVISAGSELRGMVGTQRVQCCTYPRRTPSGDSADCQSAGELTEPHIWLQEAGLYKGGKPPAFSPQDIVEFIFFPVVNEGCRVVAEGIVDKPADLDVATVLAMGFPPYR